MVDLGTGNTSNADAINEQGQVVGSSGNLEGLRIAAWAWTPTGGMMDLRPLSGYAYSNAWAINNKGQVIGLSFNRCCPADQHATMWQLPPVGDVTPPTLILPATIVVDGTSPAGAAVTYSVSASDDRDPNPVVICSPPSGSVFPLLASTVSCTATDVAGNSATGTFQVVVLDARQQLQETIDLIASYSLRRLGTSLPDKLQIASGFVAAGNVSEACGVLTGFLHQVRAQAGKALTVDQATELTMRGIRIQHVIGC